MTIGSNKGKPRRALRWTLKLRVTILATLVAALIAIPAAQGSSKATCYLSLGDSFA